MPPKYQAWIALNKSTTWYWCCNKLQLWEFLFFSFWWRDFTKTQHPQLVGIDLAKILLYPSHSFMLHCFGNIGPNLLKEQFSFFGDVPLSFMRHGQAMLVSATLSEEVEQLKAEMMKQAFYSWACYKTLEAFKRSRILVFFWF